MNEQFERGDWYIVEENENRFRLYRYDGTNWQYRKVADMEGIQAFLEEDLEFLGEIDGRRYYRPER
jgi:hypothetical protein